MHRLILLYTGSSVRAPFEEPQSWKQNSVSGEEYSNNVSQPSKGYSGDTPDRLGAGEGGRVNVGLV